MLKSQKQFAKIYPKNKNEMGPKQLTCNNFNSVTQGYFCILGLLQVMIIKFNVSKRYIVEEKIQIPIFEMKIFAFRGGKKNTNT